MASTLTRHELAQTPGDAPDHATIVHAAERASNALAYFAKELPRGIDENTRAAIAADLATIRHAIANAARAARFGEG